MVVVHCAEFGAARGGSVCAAVMPVTPRTEEPRARRVGLQIPNKLRINHSLGLGSLNADCVALQVRACCDSEHYLKAG